jgi:[ribosomal protein S18]-alanine N-acetyltransferase
MNALLQPVSHFRPMAVEDVGRVVDIEREIYAFPWSHGNFTDSLHAGYNCWVNQWDGGIVGYGVMMLAAGEAHLLNLGIAAQWQGQGLGREALEHMINVARNHRAEVMFLEVRTSNIVARRLYATRGFRVLTIRKNYYPAAQGRENAVLMELAL